MPDLEHTLQGHDLAFLKMVAEAWGLELSAPDARSALPQLVEALHDPTLVQDMIDILPLEAREALAALLQNDGQMSWSLFTRRFGEVRSMGAGRRDRERPDLHPISMTELLWYRALIGRAFMDLPPEPQEMAYIPEDLPLHTLQLIPGTHQDLPPGRPATPREMKARIPATDLILDDACTLLAALRMGLEPPEFLVSGETLTAPVLRDLLDSAGLLNTDGQPLPDAARMFLEAPRPQAILRLVLAWVQSRVINELRQLPDLAAEGTWENDAYAARKTILDWVSQVPAGTWWSLAGFVSTIHEQYPDFQRPAGDYDSWHIKRITTGQYLRGFSHWDEVDGALIRYLICGPLHWLGMVDLAAPSPEAPPTAFSLSARAADLWNSQPPASLPPEVDDLRVTADGLILMPFRSHRALRYQVSRFCEWLPNHAEGYRYHITPESLERARFQGLKVTHLLSLLRRHSAAPIPPTLVQALERWDEVGLQAHLDQVTLLRVDSPAVLDALRSTRAARWLGEMLTPTIVIIKPGAEEAVRRALLEIGYLSSPSAGKNPTEQS